MVWKDNLLVDDEPMTLEGFLDHVFSISVDLQAIHLADIRLCYFKSPKDIFTLGFHLDAKHFPRHYFFANFQCLRCGLCCKNYDSVEVTSKEQVEKWENEGREDVLNHLDVMIDEPGLFHAEIVSKSWTGCPMCRKAIGKQYYSCRVQSAKEHIPVCKSYLCSKSIPVAHLNFTDIDGLMRTIGLKEYYALVEKDWGELFDYSASKFKTHKKTK